MTIPVCMEKYILEMVVGVIGPPSKDMEHGRAYDHASILNVMPFLAIYNRNYLIFPPLISYFVPD